MYKLGHTTLSRKQENYDVDDEVVVLAVRSVFTASCNKRAINVHVTAEAKGPVLPPDTGADATLVS